MAQGVYVVKQDYIRARPIMQLQNHCPEQCHLHVEKISALFSFNLAFLLRSVKPLALIDSRKITLLEYLFKLIAGLLEITHFW